jgi:hypothetical protein
MALLRPGSSRALIPAAAKACVALTSRRFEHRVIGEHRVGGEHRILPGTPQSTTMFQD